MKPPGEKLFIGIINTCPTTDKPLDNLQVWSSVYCNVQCCHPFVIGRSRIGFELTQDFYALLRLRYVCTCRHEWGCPIKGLVINFTCLLIQKDHDTLCVSKKGGMVQGRPAKIIDGTNWSPLFNQFLERIRPGGNYNKIILPGKLILSKRKSLWEVIFSLK